MKAREIFYVFVIFKNYVRIMCYKHISLFSRLPPPKWTQILIMCEANFSVPCHRSLAAGHRCPPGSDSLQG